VWVCVARAPLSEDETKGKLFAEFSDRCFAVALKLAEGSPGQSRRPSQRMATASAFPIVGNK